MAVEVVKGEPIVLSKVDEDADYRAAALALLELVEVKTLEDITIISTLKGVCVDGESVCVL